jgi:hypothetical protein
MSRHKKMTKEEATAFKDRWRRVNEFIDEELRNTSPEVKLKQLSGLYNTAVFLGWLEKLREGEEEIWSRWQKLRERYGQTAAAF